MSTTRNILNLAFWSLALLLGPYIFSSSRVGGLGGLSIFGFDVPAWLYYVVGGLLWLQSLASLIGSRREGAEQTGLTAPGGGYNSPSQVEPTIRSATASPVTANDELSPTAESSGSTTDAPNKLGAYVAQLREVDDERVNELLVDLQDRMAYKREAALNDIQREKIANPRIIEAVRILAASDRVDTIRRIAARVLDTIEPSTTRRWLAQDNLGTRYQDAAHARTVWLASHLTTYTPVVIYRFPTLDAAHQAITQLSFIHEAADTGELIATEVVEFGCFVNEDGQGEVMICGKGFTLNRWQEAMDKLAAAGGILHREQKPEAQPSATITPAAPEERPAVLAAPAAPTKTDNVTFVSEDHKGMHTYRVHRAPSKAAAMAFLQANPVTQNYLYLIVETPHGDFGRDINGIYEE